MSDSLQVWLDTDFLTDKLQIGTLFAIDPDLSLGDGVFHPKPDQGNFRVFDDSASDRWGQMPKTFGGEFHTFCVKRFDRVGNRRRFYASAMAMPHANVV